MLRLKHLPVAFLLCYPFFSEAATNKCTDGKRITYANVPCEKLGLQSVGPVKSMVTVLPATPAPDRSGKGSDAPVPNAEGKATGGTTVKPVSPLVEKLLN